MAITTSHVIAVELLGDSDADQYKNIPQCSMRSNLELPNGAVVIGRPFDDSSDLVDTSSV